MRKVNRCPKDQSARKVSYRIFSIRNLNFCWNNNVSPWFVLVAWFTEILAYEGKNIDLTLRLDFY